MIAICPSCHHETHHSRLEISDETLRRWKRIVREEASADHIYVEPAEQSKILLGSIAVTGDSSGVRIFELAPNSELSFDLVDGRFMHLNLRVATAQGDELLRVSDGHVTRQSDERLSYQYRKGHCRLEAPLTADFMPEWALAQVRRAEPTWGQSGRFPLADIEVWEPGLIKVEGAWLTDDRGIVVTDRLLSFVSRDRPGPLGFAGEGPDSVLLYTGRIGPLFSFGEQPVPAKPSKPRRPPGRNETCWCGSGVKYKRCHGR